MSSATPARDRTIPLDLIRRAASTIGETAIRTPLIRLDIDAPCEIFLKLENLQPTGAFKIRGAAFGVLDRAGEDLSAGVWAASSGNMASALSYVARRFSIPCTVLMPDTATETKVRAVERLGARAVRVGYSEWWQALSDRDHPEATGVFFHGFDDVRMMAADGTIGLEIAEDLPDADAVVVPFGGGGLACGIGSALKQAGTKARVLAAEFDRLAPLTAAPDRRVAGGCPRKAPPFPGRCRGTERGRVDVGTCTAGSGRSGDSFAGRDRTGDTSPRHAGADRRRGRRGGGPGLRHEREGRPRQGRMRCLRRQHRRFRPGSHPLRWGTRRRVKADGDRGHLLRHPPHVWIRALGGC